MNEELQAELMERFQSLTKKEHAALGNIDQNGALVLLYNVIPEANQVLMHLPSLKGHQFDPKRLLHGTVSGGATVQDESSQSQEIATRPEGSLPSEAGALQGIR